MERRRNAGSNAQNKMIQVNDKFGNTGIKNQQGTTRIMYDSLPLVVSTKEFVLEFFTGCKTRKFPYTNLVENKLQVGETITIEDYYFNLIEVDVNNVVIRELPFEYFKQTEGLYRADLDFMIGESRVLKGVKVGSSQSSFNYGANFLNQIVNMVTPVDPNIALTVQEKGHDVYPLRTDLVIPPDIQFSAPVKFSGINALPPVTTQGNLWHVVITMEGRGSLLAMRTTV